MMKMGYKDFSGLVVSSDIPLNLFFPHRFYFDYGINLAFHLPVISMELKDVRLEIA